MSSKVTVDGTDFFEVTDDVWADAPYAIRIQVGRALTESEAQQFAGLVGYAYAKTGGERGNGYHQDSPNSIVYYCDTTKGRAYNHLDTFFEDVKVMAVEGSPPRKTKGGTRLIEGLGDVGDITFFADSVGGLPYTPAPSFNDDPTSRGFNDEGVHDNGTLLDNNYRDVNGDSYRTREAPLDPRAERVVRAPDNTVVKFSFRNGEPVAFQKLRFTDDGEAAWTAKRATTVGDGKELLENVTALPKNVRAVPESVAVQYGKATGSCLICSRPLSSKVSLSAGYGPECKSKMYGGN